MPWWEPFSNAWAWYSENRENLTPIGAFLGGGTVAWAALRQARNSTRQAVIATEQAKIAAQQADTASRRHEEQTGADRQRRITESFGKAVEQLAGDKIEARLGGIYTLERISRESEEDYWAVMETLTGFVRERAPVEPDVNAADTMEGPHVGFPRPPTDIRAILSVLSRRSDRSREREKVEGWRLDLRDTYLKWAYLKGAHLEGATFGGACLSRAELTGAHLEKAFLLADLRGAHLRGAHLEGATFLNALLEGADLGGAHLEGAILWEAFIMGADLRGAHLEGADLRGVTGLSPDQIAETFGDAATQLPDDLLRPPHWPRLRKPPKGLTSDAGIPKRG